MRPRVFPAEDEALMAATTAVFVASMRPRVFPAEDTYTRVVIIEAGPLQ